MIFLIICMVDRAFEYNLVNLRDAQFFLIYRVIRDDCRRFNNTSSFCYLRTLQVLCMCTLCDSTNINTIIEFVPNCSMSAMMASMAVLIRKLRSKRRSA